MIAPVWLLLQREMRQSFRRWSDLISPLVFFVVVASLFPLAISPAADVLRQVGPGVLWVAALLSMLLSMNRLFRDDYEDGSLEQLVLAPQPLVLLVLGKVLAHWLQMVLPLLLLTPAVATAYDLPGEATWVLLLSLLLGTPALSLIGGDGWVIQLRNCCRLMERIPPVDRKFNDRHIDDTDNGDDAAGSISLIRIVVCRP